MRGLALLSDCGRYRYWLARIWDPTLPTLVWVMLNPSTADADDDDPTIRRVIGFSKREGFGTALVVNVWALIATDPKDLHERRGAFEPENLRCVEQAVSSRQVVAAWGSHIATGPALQRVRMAIRELAAGVWCLGLTKGQAAKGGMVRVNRQPRHPLRLRADTPMEPYRF